MADVAEERGLGAIQRGERFGAAALFVNRPRVGHAFCDLAGHEVQESSVVLVEFLMGIYACDQNTHSRLLTSLCDGKKNQVRRVSAPEAARQSDAKGWQIAEFDGAGLLQGLPNQRCDLGFASQV